VHQLVNKENFEKDRYITIINICAVGKCSLWIVMVIGCH